MSMVLNGIFSLLFIIGLTIVYIPQMYKIIHLRSSHGINKWFLFLGHTASALSVLNATIFYLKTIADCGTFAECLEDLSGFWVMIFQWLAYWIQYVVYVYYYPTSAEIDIDLEDNSSTSSIILAPQGGGGFGGQAVPLSMDVSEYPELKTVKRTFVISHLLILLFSVATIPFIILNGWRNDVKKNLYIWGTIIDIVISIMFFIHYIPQVLETIKLRRVGSMSLISLALLCPGTFVWTIFLATQGSVTPEKQTGTILLWGPYLFVGSSQALLLVLGLRYEYGFVIVQTCGKFYNRISRSQSYSAIN